MVWMLENVMKVYKPEANLFPQCFHKLLFMTQIEDYWRVDGWPDEASRNLYVKGTFFSKIKFSLVISTTFEFSRQNHDAKIRENRMFRSTPNPKQWHFDNFKYAKPLF